MLTAIRAPIAGMSPMTRIQAGVAPVTAPRSREAAGGWAC